MAASRVMIGHLVPLQRSLVADDSHSNVPIYEGENVVGRNTLTISDKRVSRKHIQLHASVDGLVEVVVEGPNPVILKSGNKRKKLCNQEKVVIGHGDILELIPGNHLFKYEAIGCGHVSLAQTNSSFLSKGKRPGEEESSVIKRNRQTKDVEAFARTLQDKQEGNNFVRDGSSVDAIHSGSRAEPTTSFACDDMEAIRRFNVSKDRLPFIFRLMQVQGLPTWANSPCVAVDDVIQGNVLVAILSNYMVDIDWLLSACPALRKIPHVLIVHGETGDHLKKKKAANWMLHKPPLPISYGTHHSKAMLLVYPQGVRVVVHTANLIYVDWNNKTQGLWMQDFPWKDQNNITEGSHFENDLIDYLNVLKWPEFSANVPKIGNVNINASFFRKFDYSRAAVRLVASVPGYHAGANLKKWGHMKLRSILDDCIFDEEFCNSPLIYQFSSLGSLDEKWVAEFAKSTSSGISSDKSPLGIGKPLIIWPTVEDVRCSLEGYAAGNAIPSPQKNVEKDFLKKYWARWKASHVGRWYGYCSFIWTRIYKKPTLAHEIDALVVLHLENARAMPHIKTYTRYNGQNLAWFLLTSANLSKAAWGALQKNNSQLMIRSYELGVLFLPSSIQDNGPGFSCTEYGASELKPSRMLKDCRARLVTLCWKGSNESDSSSEVIRLPVPYQLPPQPYTSEDIPWSWDKRYTKKDVYGQVWPRHVQLYMDQDS